MINYITVGSSHFRSLNRTAGVRDVRNVVRCHHFPGIMMLNLHRSPGKQIQFNDFRDAIRTNPVQGVILESLSNDWEALLTLNGDLLKVSEKVIVKWESSTLNERKKWSYRMTQLTKEGKARVKEGLDRYGGVLQDVFGGSGTSELVQLSVLERRYTRTRDSAIDVLFATLNSMLKQWCKNLTLRNSRGKEINVRFISISEPYLRVSRVVKDVFEIFEEVEVRRYKRGHGQHQVWGNYMVHRNRNGYREVFRMVDEILNG